MSEAVGAAGRGAGSELGAQRGRPGDDGTRMAPNGEASSERRAKQTADTVCSSAFSVAQVCFLLWGEQRNMIGYSSFYSVFDATSSSGVATFIATLKE